MFIVLIYIFVKYGQSFILSQPSGAIRNDFQKLSSLTRNGVCLPKDVAIYGSFKAAYYALYTKDGETKTGDEWEDEMVGKNPFMEIEEIPDKPYNKIKFNPPLNTENMLLRDGIPFLTLNMWAPGVEASEIKVILDYSLDSAPAVTKYKSLGDPVDCNGLCTDKDREYYESAKGIDLETPETDDVKNEEDAVEIIDEYDGTYSQINEKTNKFSYKSGTESKIKPPLIVINCPKNTIVSQWERSVFRGKDQRSKEVKRTRVQRCYRPFTHIDLQNISCTYTDCTIQFHAPLTYIPPPPAHRKAQLLRVPEGLPLYPVKSYHWHQVHGWIYNWRMFKDVYTKKLTEETYDPDAPITPDFGDVLSKGEYHEFMKAIKKNK